MRKEKDMSVYIDLGKKIKAERLNLRLSQTQIAKDLKISFQTYRRYEKGTNEMPLDIILKISKIFNIDLNNLLETSIKNQNTTGYELEKGQLIIKKIK
jgi:transcriptional regulator with XRE-family HTH domain